MGKSYRPGMCCPKQHLIVVPEVAWGNLTVQVCVAPKQHLIVVPEVAWGNLTVQVCVPLNNT